MDKLRVGQALSSPVTALFAASPLVDGRLTDFQSYRARVWLDTDPDRCGLLPFAFDPHARFRDYVEWALDVPMFFVYRGGEYIARGGMTFRRFMRDGWQGQRALMPSPRTGSRASFLARWLQAGVVFKTPSSMRSAAAEQR